jgi:hypothetical protein
MNRRQAYGLVNVETAIIIIIILLLLLLRNFKNKHLDLFVKQLQIKINKYYKESLIIFTNVLMF